MLKPYIDCQNTVVSTKALLVAGYIVNETENHILNATGENIEFLVDILLQSLKGLSVSESVLCYHLTTSPPDPHYPDTPTTAPQPLRTRPLFSSALLLVPRAAMRLEPFVLLRSQQIPHRRLRCFASLPPGGGGVPRSPPVKGQLRRKFAKALH